MQQFPAAFAPLKGEFNITGISDLYNQTDFIGISSYPSLTPNFSTEQLEAATQQFDFEIGQFGVDLKTLNVQQVTHLPFMLLLKIKIFLISHVLPEDCTLLAACMMTHLQGSGYQSSYCSACSFAEWSCNCTMHSRTT